MVGPAHGPGGASGDRSPLPSRPEPGVEAPPPATGIDYLRLVEARADAALAARISYAGMPDIELPGDGDDGDGTRSDNDGNEVGR